LISHLIAGRISACRTHRHHTEEIPRIPVEEENGFSLDQLIKGIADGFGVPSDQSQLISDIVDISLKVLPLLFDEEEEANSKLIHLLKPFISALAPLFEEDNMSGKELFEGIRTVVQAAMKVAPVVLPYILKLEEENGFWESFGKGLGTIAKMAIQVLPTILSEENGENSELLELINRIKEQIKDFPISIPEILGIAKRFAEYLQLDKPTVDYEEDANDTFEKISRILKKALEAAIQELGRDEEENLSVPKIKPARSYDEDHTEEIKESHHHHHHHHRVHSPRQTIPKKNVALG